MYGRSRIIKQYLPWIAWRPSERNIRHQQFSTNIAPKPRICVVGAGPAGFYVTQYILKTLPAAHIDIIERLPVPFGLVRFGVAPDHPEVKNVINTFTKTAENPRVTFIGNLSLGKDVSLRTLRDVYNAVVLCYGAEADRHMGIQGEDGNVLSAREIVAWYNGLPGQTSTSHFDAIEQQLLKANKISIVGQGNVAIDIARIVLSPIDMLRTTDITSRALAILADCRIECIELIGRRGPLQAAFTIKELREMLKLPNVQTQWHARDFNGIDDSVISSLPRPKKRITELMWKNAMANTTNATATATLPKQFVPYFYRSPALVRVNPPNGKLQLQLIKNRVNDAEVAIATDESETIDTDVILRSIGYKSINVTDAAENLNFDERRGAVRNVHGRVQRPDDNSNEHGLYVSGWLGTGPTGVILTTMNNSFSVAKNICDDFQNGRIDCDHKPGLEVLKFPSTFAWSDWLKIDSYEREVGALSGKPREKILTVEQMLALWK